MLSFAVKAVWFALCLLGTISAWVTLFAFARVVGSYWGPMAYCIAVTLLDGAFSLGEFFPKLQRTYQSLSRNLCNRINMANGPIPYAANFLSRPNCSHQLQRISIDWNLRLHERFRYNFISSAIQEH
jgi:hypothetical protein